MTKNKKTTIIEIFVLFIVALVPLLWFKDGKMALGHDMGFPLAPIDHFVDRLFVWTQRVGSFGSNQAESVSGFFIHGLEALFSYLGFGLIATQKLVFIFWLFAPGLAMYIFLRYLQPEKKYWPLRMFGSLFYMFNHFFLQAWFIAERTKFSAAVSLPIITLLTINTFYKKKSAVFNGLLVGLTLFFFNAGPGIPLYAGLGLVMFLTALFLIGKQMSKKSLLAHLKRLLTFFFVSALTFIFLNFYWIAPLFLYSSQNFSARVSAAGGVEGAISWSREISKYASFANLFRLQGIPDWYANSEHPYSNTFINNPFFVLLSFIWPILAFSSFLYIKTKKQKTLVVLFVLLALIGMFFTSGTNGVNGKLYEFLIRNVPGFSVLRTPFYKFGIVVWFSYSFLIGYTVSRFLEWIKLPDKLKVIEGVGKHLLLGSLFILLAVYNYPYFTGSFFDWSRSYSTMLKVPEYVFEFKNFLSQLPNHSSHRFLLLPNLDKNTKYEIYDWRYFSLSTLPTVLTRKSFVANDAYLMPNESTLVEALYDKLSSEGDFRLAKYLGINYLLVRNDFAAPVNANYQTESLLKEVKNSSVFEKTNSFGRWDLYKNVTYTPFPLLYASPKSTYIAGTLDSFSKVLEIPNLDTNDNFFITETLHDYELDQSMIGTRIIKGNCASCLPSETFIAEPEPRIFPQSRLLYFLESLFEKRQEKSIALNTEKIDYLLGKALKKHTLIESTLLAEKNTSLIPDILEDIVRNYNRASELLSEIENTQTRELYNKRITDYRNFSKKQAVEWISSTNDNSLQAKFLDMQWEIENISLTKLEKKVLDKHTFSFSIPRDSNYTMYLRNDEIFLDKYSDFVDLELDQGSLSKAVQRLDSNWVTMGFFDLAEGEQKIRVPYLESVNVENLLPTSFEVLSPIGENTCTSFAVPNVNKELKYKVAFTYRTQIGEPVRFQVRQNLDYFTKTQRPRYKVNSLLKKDFTWSSFETQITPDKYTNTLQLDFCINSNGLEDSIVNIDNLTLTVKGEPDVFLVDANSKTPTTNPLVNFVKINPTKYLVSVENNKEKSYLNFNQRFDDGWTIRPITIENKDLIFSSDHLIYQDAYASEYSYENNLDNLRVTGEKVSDHLINNGYNNAWVIEPGENTYLLEYQPQKLLYLGALVSGSFLLFVIGYLLVKTTRFK